MSAESIIYLVVKETSDQLGTTEVVAAYSSRVLAEECVAAIHRSRSFIKEMPLDKPLKTALRFMGWEDGKMVFDEIYSMD